MTTQSDCKAHVRGHFRTDQHGRSDIPRSGVRDPMSKAMHCLLAACVTCVCASPQTLPPPPPAPLASPVNAVTREFSSGPVWLRRGCDHAFAGQGKQVICGVDGITSATNAVKARTGAEAKARANLARRIRTAVKAGLRTYQAIVKDGDSDRTREELSIEETSQEITEMTLVWVKVYDTYLSPEGGVWVMVFMDFDSFRQQVQSLDQYEENMRKEIVGRAEELFRELDEATVGSEMVPSPNGSLSPGPDR